MFVRTAATEVFDMSDYIKTVTDADFDQIVIEGSRHAPVVVDFWAPWCGPCRALTPVLERLAEEYQGKFILAKVNADENPALSQRYAVRSIPSVMGFAHGELVDQFLGAQPESGVREFLDRLVPSAAELLRQEANRHRTDGNIERAVQLLNQAASLEPANELVLTDLVETLLDSNRIAQAREAGARLKPLRSRYPRAAQVLARLELADDGTQQADAAALTQRIEARPDDLEARLAFAKLHARNQDYERALEQLLEVLKRDRAFGDDVARKTMLALFELIGNEDPLVRRYRKELAAALH
jgi:putative thioredoxin